MPSYCNSTRTAAAALISVAALSIPMAHAQVERSGGGENAALVQELQQLGEERSSLQAENAKLQSELDAMRKERDSLKSAQQALEQRAQASENEVKSVQQSAAAQRQASDNVIAQWRASQAQLLAKAREIAESLRQVETDRTSIRQALALSERDLKDCSDKNLALYKLDDEALTRLEHQGFWSSLARAEPFTRIKRIQLENYIEESRERADAQRMPASAHPAASATLPVGASPPAATSN